MSLKVHLATPTDKDRWDAYGAKMGSFFHRFGWGEAIKATYGHDPLYLYAEQNDGIVGVLPLIDRQIGRAHV